MADEYTCQMCGKTYKKGRSDEDVKAEMEGYFGEVPDDDQVVVCDDCFNKIHPTKFPLAVAVSRLMK